MRGGFLSTLPLHWEGDLPTFKQLVDEVMTRRMGGFDETFYVYQVRKHVVSHPSGGSPTWLHEVSVANTPMVP